MRAYFKTIAILAVVFLVGTLAGWGIASARAQWTAYLASFSGSRITLAFSISGTLSSVVPAGTAVTAGETVAALNAADLDTRLQNARVDLATAEAQVSIAGQNSRQAESQEQAFAVKNAHAVALALGAAASSTQAAVADTDALFMAATSTNPVLLVPAEPLSAAAAESGRVSVAGNIGDLAAIRAKAMDASSTPAALSDLADNATDDIAEVQLFLESLTILAGQASATPAISPAMHGAWQSDIVAARSRVTAVIGSLLSAQNALANAQALAVPGASVSQKNAQNALAAAQAEVASTTAALAAAVIHAPQAGIVAAPEKPATLPRVGEYVSAGQAIVSLHIAP